MTDSKQPLVIVVPAEGPPRVATEGENPAADSSLQASTFTAVTSGGFVNAQIYSARERSPKDDFAIEMLIARTALPS